MERHEVISIEEYLAKRKAIREQENNKNHKNKENTDTEPSQIMAPLAYYDILSVESSLC